MPPACAGCGRPRSSPRSSAARCAQDVADHRVQLDVGLFERLLDPLDMAGLLAAQLLAGTQQRTQLLDRPRPERSSPGSGRRPTDRQSTSHRSRRSCGRNILDVGRIGHDQFERAIAQDVPHRLPVDPGRLHRHVGAPESASHAPATPSWPVVVSKVRHSRFIFPAAITAHRPRSSPCAHPDRQPSHA